MVCLDASRIIFLIFAFVDCKRLLPPNFSSHGYASLRLLKTIHSRKYGVDQVVFTHHPSAVLYSSKNGWDGEEMPYDIGCAGWKVRATLRRVQYKVRLLRCEI